jgi:uncharacterized membrane protein
MSPSTLTWLLVAHLIGVFLWIGGLFAVYWLLRIHGHAPKDVSDQLTLMERSLALSMDLAATIAIGCGLAMALGQKPNLFVAHGAGWFHIKLALVVVGILPVHGFVRAKIKRFSLGQITPIPQWPWSLLLATIAAIVIMVIKGPMIFS